MTVFHIDSVHGDDGNSGQTPLSPLQTIAALPNPIPATTRLRLARGSYWPEQLKLHFGNVTVEDYIPPQSGAIAPPTLDGSDEIMGLTPVSGYPSVSQTDLSIPPNVKNYMNVFEDGAYLTRVASIASCEATPGSYYIPDDTIANPMLYVHDTGGFEFRATVRPYCVDAYSLDKVMVRGLKMGRSLHENGACIAGREATIADCMFDDGNLHSVLLADGSEVRRCVFGKHRHTSAQTAIVFNENKPDSRGLWVTDTTFSVPEYQPTLNAIFAHHNTDGDFGRLTVQGCQFYNYGGCVLPGPDVAAVELSNCWALDCDELLRINAPIYYSLVGNTFHSAIPNAKAINTIMAGGRLGIDDDKYTIASPQGGVIALMHDTNLGLNNVQVKTTAGSPASGCLFIAGGAAVDLSMYDSCLDAVGSQNIRALAALQSYTGNRNRYTHDGPNELVIKVEGDVYKTLADWQAATGQDAASVIGGC